MASSNEQIIFVLENKQKIVASDKVKPLLLNAEKFLGRKIEFLSRNEDSQANYRAGDFSDPESGKIFYDPTYDYNTDEGQRKVAHELLHVIYFHRDHLPFPKPLEELSVEEKLILERTCGFVEDLFVNYELNSLGFARDNRYHGILQTIRKALRQGLPPSHAIRFNRAPESQQDLMLEQSAIMCFIDDYLMSDSENALMLELVVDAKLGEGTAKKLRETIETLKNLLGKENKKDAVTEAQALIFQAFDIRRLLARN